MKDSNQTFMRKEIAKYLIDMRKNKGSIIKLLYWGRAESIIGAAWLMDVINFRQYGILMAYLRRIGQ